MSELENSPRDVGGETPGFVFTRVAQGSLDAETPGQILMAHQLVVFLSEVAIHWQCPVDFIDKHGLGV